MAKLMDWIDDRFPATKVWQEHMAQYYAPKNFNFWYYFGSLALLVLVLQIATGIVLTASPVWAFDGHAAGAFSSRGCVGCHAAGGNVVSASATLFSQDLERNGLTSKDDIARVIELGRGKMPGYGEACAPKGACTFGARLDAEEIDALAAFVLERAGEDW